VALAPHHPKRTSVNRRPHLLLATSATLALGLLAGCSSDDTPAAPSASGSASSTSDATSAPATGPAQGSGDGEAQAAAAATWLQAQAAAGTVFQTEFDGVAYDDYGLTADVVLALLAADQDDAAQTYAEALTTDEAVAAYVGDGTTAQYAGATGKLLAVTDAADLPTDSIGGRDLTAELLAIQTDEGRFSDLGAEDYSQTISQSWAVAALATQDAAPQQAVDYLAAQQCEGAGFPAQLSSSAPADCVSDVDSTAFAVSALVVAGTDDDAPVIMQALAWLDSVGAADDAGTSWASADSDGPSVNSTAVAVSAFEDGDADASQGIAWLMAQQVTDGEDAGAFLLADQPDVRTTAQATVALAGEGLDDLLG
jgi:hypothetical protein